MILTTTNVYEFDTKAVCTVNINLKAVIVWISRKHHQLEQLGVLLVEHPIVPCRPIEKFYDTF